MAANNEQNNSTNRLAKAGKVVILFIITFVGLACILLYFHLRYMLIALFAILALVISVVLFAKQTHFKIYSLPAVITSLFFIASCIIMAYGDYSDGASISLKMVGLELFMIGVGFLVDTAVMAASDMNKLDFWKSEYAIEFKYPMYQLIMGFIAGAFMIVSGLYTVVISLKIMLLI